MRINCGLRTYPVSLRDNLLQDVSFPCTICSTLRSGRCPSTDSWGTLTRDVPSQSRRSMMRKEEDFLGLQVPCILIGYVDVNHIYFDLSGQELYVRAKCLVLTCSRSRPHRDPTLRKPCQGRLLVYPPLVYSCILVLCAPSPCMRSR